MAERAREGPAMPSDPLALEKLLREAAEARLKEVALVSRGEEILDRARAVARAIAERARRVTAPERQRPDAHTSSPLAAR
jgi:hypothetical protein